MDYRRNIIFQSILIMVITTCIVYMVLDKPDIIYKDGSETCKEDSLRLVINQLQSDLEIEENGWDRKETRYENIIFEYEYGLDHLKNYHPNAYRDFHRIIGYKEKYSRDTERENKKRMSANNF